MRQRVRGEPAVKKPTEPRITRRDFLDGIALLGGAAALGPLHALGEVAADAPVAGVYPPLLTGMRGNHPGSFEVAHALAREGRRATAFEPIDDVYDLIVVGAGISGLAAAYLYRKQHGPAAKILLLDNHDDFGGHAKRNEFNSGHSTLLGVGGSLNLEQAEMAPEILSFLEEIGVDFTALRRGIEKDYIISDPMSRHGLYLNAAVFGEDRTLAGSWNLTWAGMGDVSAAVAALQLSPADEAALVGLASGDNAFVSDVPVDKLENFMHETAYADFLSQRVGLSDAGIKITEPWIKALFGVGADSVSIYEALKSGAPGMNTFMPPSSETLDSGSEDLDAYRYPMFPDGNASVARLLVRQLIPSVVRGEASGSVVTDKFDYSQLDSEASPIRLRLNSTVVNARNRDDGLVDVSYVVDGKPRAVRASHCILAGYGGMVPHLCPELPEPQKAQLAYGVKVPFICTNVLLRSGAAIRETGVSGYQCPGSFYSLVATAPPVKLGAYQTPSGANDPLVVWGLHAAAPDTNGNGSARDAYRLGRHQLLSMSFEEIESATLQQLSGMFAATGFDPKRDIEAITVNRWAHGYAYEYMELHDPAWPPGEAPHELGRAPVGRISIANSDSEAYAYVQAAVKAAMRAVEEVLA